MGKSSCGYVSLVITLWSFGVSNKIKNDSNHQTAAGAHGNVLLVTQVVEGDLKAIAARTRIVVDLESFVEGHVFDLDLVVDRKPVVSHRARGMRDAGDHEDVVYGG